MRAPNESLGGDVFPKSVCTERMPLLKGEVPAAQAEGFKKTQTLSASIYGAQGRR